MYFLKKVPKFFACVPGFFLFIHSSISFSYGVYKRCEMLNNMQ